MPDKPFFAAASNLSFNSSIEKSFSAAKVKSNSETFETGTLTASPSSLPLNSGKTSPTAEAAPVFVGIIDKLAALARKRSE